MPYKYLIKKKHSMAKTLVKKKYSIRLIDLIIKIVSLKTLTIKHNGIKPRRGKKKKEKSTMFLY